VFAQKKHCTNLFLSLNQSKFLSKGLGLENVYSSQSPSCHQAVQGMGDLKDLGVHCLVCSCSAQWNPTQHGLQFRVQTTKPNYFPSFPITDVENI
jgi:hypothetical protein